MMYAQRTVRLTVSKWTLTGSTTTHPTPRTPQLDLRDMITICTTRKSLIMSCSSFCSHIPKVWGNAICTKSPHALLISLFRASQPRVRTHTWRAYAVSHTIMSQKRIAHTALSSDLQRIQADAALGNSPLWFGEWGLPTQFNATNEFLYKWADAQKWAYSQSAGWIVSSSRLL